MSISFVARSQVVGGLVQHQEVGRAEEPSGPITKGLLAAPTEREPACPRRPRELEGPQRLRNTPRPSVEIPSGGCSSTVNSGSSRSRDCWAK